MYGGDEFLKVSRFDNGFSVEIKDPGIIKYNKARDEKNATSKGATYLEYKDPWRNFIFDTAEKAQEFIGKNIGKAIIAAKVEDSNEYETAFDLAVATDAKPKQLPAPTKQKAK